MEINLRVFKFKTLSFIRKLKIRIGIKQNVFEWQLFCIAIDDIIQGFMFEIKDESSIDCLYNFTKEFLGTLKNLMDTNETMMIGMDHKYGGYGWICFYEDDLMTEEDVKDMKRRYFGKKTGSLFPA